MKKVYEIYVKTTPERLWEAITDGEMRSKYQFGAHITSDYTPGSRYELGHPNSPVLLGEGETSRLTRRAGWSRAPVTCSART